jgi:hypothetical protein
MMKPGTKAISLSDVWQFSVEVLAAQCLRALHGGELGFAEIDESELLADGISPERLSRLTSLIPRRLPCGARASCWPTTTG